MHRPDTQIVDEPGWYEIITPSAVGYLNEIYVSQIAEGDADPVIERVIARHRAARKTVKWCVGHWSQPEDLRDRLIARGFVAHPVRAMGTSTSTMPVVAQDTACREMTAADLDTYLNVTMAGWGAPADQREAEHRAYSRTLAAEPRTAHFFLGSLGGEAVGTAGVFLRGDYAYLVGGLVLPSARGRGVHGALVESRLAFLRERGVEYAVTHARDATSSPILEHFGFETLYRYDCLYLPFDAA